MTGSERDRIYAKYHETAMSAAKKIWSAYGATLIRHGIELDDLTQHAEMTFLEILPKLDTSNTGLPNFIYKSIEGSIRDRFLRGELERFANQTPAGLLKNYTKPAPNPDNFDENLILSMEDDDLTFCELVLQGYKPHEARRKLGWNMDEYRAAKKRIAEYMGVAEDEH